MFLEKLRFYINTTQLIMNDTSEFTFCRSIIAGRFSYSTLISSSASHFSHLSISHICPSSYSDLVVVIGIFRVFHYIPV